MNGFKQFILRGNVLDLAVAVVIGAAFGEIVKALVADLLTPLIGMLGGKPDFSAFKIGPFLIGNFVNSVISFLLIAAAVYFFVVLPVNSLINRMRREEIPSDPTTKKCPECFSDIPTQARRCAHCTSAVS